MGANSGGFDAPVEDVPMRPVDYLPDARRDFDESFDWYAKRSAVAAERFSNAVDAALNRIALSLLKSINCIANAS